MCAGNYGDDFDFAYFLRVEFRSIGRLIHQTEIEESRPEALFNLKCGGFCQEDSNPGVQAEEFRHSLREQFGPKRRRGSDLECTAQKAVEGIHTLLSRLDLE